LFVTLVTLVTLAGGALLFGACEDEAVIVEEIVRPVRYTAVAESGGATVRSFSGSAQPGSASRLSFRVAGNVEAIAVDVGDTVAPGDLIAQIDATPYELQVEQAQAAASQARAESRNARANYDRVTQLYENNTASRAELDAARAGNDSASAYSRSTRQQVQMARDQVEYCRLEAPVEGDIASIEVEVNENVSAGQPIVLLTSGTDTEAEVEVAIPETVITRVVQGATVAVTFDAIPDREFEATVTEVGVAPGLMASTFPVVVRLNEATDEVRPGMAAEVTFSFGADDEAGIWVPAHTVSEDGEGRFVYVVDPDEPAEAGLGTVHRRRVEVGILDQRGIEITTGLEPGEPLVTAGIHRIWDGLVVTFPNEFEEAGE